MRSVEQDLDKWQWNARRTRNICRSRNIHGFNEVQNMSQNKKMWISLPKTEVQTVKQTNISTCQPMSTHVNPFSHLFLKQGSPGEGPGCFLECFQAASNPAARLRYQVRVELLDIFGGKIVKRWKSSHRIWWWLYVCCIWTDFHLIFRFGSRAAWDWCPQLRHNSCVVRSIYAVSALPIDVTESKDKSDTSSDPFIAWLLNGNLDIFT